MHARVWLSVVLAFVVAAVLVALGTWQPAFADPSDLTVGSVVWGRITHDAGGYTADQRIVLVRKRVTNILSNARYKSATHLFVVASAMGSSATIAVGALSGGTAYLVVTVTPQDAMGQGVSAHNLASRWATKLSQGLNKAMPTTHFDVKQQ